MDGYEKLMEQYDEAAFALMMDRSAEEEGAELLRSFREASDAGALPEYSEALDRRCRDAIEREFGKRTRRVRFRRFAQSLARAAVVAFAMIGLAGTLIMSVEAWRAPFINIFIHHFDEYTSNPYGETQEFEVFPCSVFDRMLPAGYEQLRYTNTDNLTVVIYGNESEGLVSFTALPANSQMNVDGEDALISHINLHSYDALLFEKEGYQVIWTCEEAGKVYTFQANQLTKDQFMELAYELAIAGSP